MIGGCEGAILLATPLRVRKKVPGMCGTSSIALKTPEPNQFHLPTYLAQLASNLQNQSLLALSEEAKKRHLENVKAFDGKSKERATKRKVTVTKSGRTMLHNLFVLKNHLNKISKRLLKMKRNSFNPWRSTQVSLL